MKKNQNGETLLFNTCENENKSITKILIEYGININ